MYRKRFLRCILFAALMIGLVPAAMMAAEGDATGSIKIDGTEVTAPTTIDEDATITVTGNAVLNGSGGDAITINADVTMDFEQGATLTVTGYDNAFVIENGTLTGGGWHIIDGDGLDLFRLKNSSELNITSDVDLDGNGVGNTTSRAIVLPGGGAQDQVVIVANGATLHANDFYRGIETGAAQNYSVKGESKTGSTYDLSGNDCGIFINYGDRNAHYNNCTIDVKNCKTSGIFMHQHNASLNGLYIDNVVINCINDPEVYTEKYGVTGQQDIAIRFHTVAFSITDSEINIENAWNTGLWIFDGWEKGNTKEIKDTTITVKNVEQSPNTSIAAQANRKKAITFVPYGTWTIEGCVFTMEGTAQNKMQCGLNVGNDTQISTSSGIKAKPSMYGGTLNISDSSFETNYLEYMDIGVQIGQFVNIGADVVIDNDYADSAARGNEHYTILCDTIEGKFPVTVLGITLRIDYDVQNMAAEYQVPNRVTVSGGSYYSSTNDSLNVLGYSGEGLFQSSIPVNVDGEKLTMFTVTPEKYSEYMSNGIIDILRNDGTSEYQYQATKASADRNRYIWAPAATVTFVDSGNNTLKTEVVPRGAAFGLVADLPADYDCGDFTEATEVNGDMTVEVQ